MNINVIIALYTSCKNNKQYYISLCKIYWSTIDEKPKKIVFKTEIRIGTKIFK